MIKNLVYNNLAPFWPINHMKNVMSFFTMFPLLGCLCRFLFKVFITVTCHSLSRQPGQTCMRFFLYMACMPLWHAIHFQDSHAKPAWFFPFTWHVCDCDMPFIFKIAMPNLHVFFFSWHACMCITWNVFFAKPVGYNFSVAILLACTEHMGIPNIHASHEHTFHA